MMAAQRAGEPPRSTRPLQYETTTPTRSLTLENPRKGWKGAPFAAVQVGQYRPGRWIWATSMALTTGEGHSSPLGRWNDSPVHHEHPSEEAALEAAFAHLLAKLAATHRPDDKAIPAIRAWATARGRVTVQADLFQEPQ